MALDATYQGDDAPRLAVNRSGFWEIRWTDRDDTGRARSRTYSCRTKDRRVAEDVMRGWLTANRVAAPLTGTITVRDGVARYLKGHVDKNGRTGAQDFNLRNVVRELGDVRVADLTEAMVDRFAAARMAAGFKSGTVRRELSALRAALAWCVKKGLVPSGSVVHFDLPPESAPRTRFLDEAEETALWNEAKVRALRGDRVGLFVCLALETAARSEAIRGLTWDRVDLRRGLIDYNEPGRRLSNKRRAVVPMSQRLEPVLAACGQGAQADAPVLGHSGSVRDGFVRLCADVGLAGVTIHDLRRTWASLRVSWGVPLQDVAAILGDSLEITQKHYAHLSPDYLRSAVNTRGRAGMGRG
jgi:integrase